MRILLYVMNFFIFSAENTPIDKWCETRRLVGLSSYSCYIRRMYEDENIFEVSGIFGKSNYGELKKHKYYENNVMKIKFFDEGKKRKQFLPTLVKLLDAIPDTIIIKRGIIYTKADSIVSGIDITKTISTDDTNTNKQTNKYIPTGLPCNPSDPETKYGDIEHVIMDGTDIYAYYRCGGSLEKQKFQLSDEESEKKIIKKIDMPCTLRLDIVSEMNDFFEPLTPVLNIDEKLKKNMLQFELQFSYICKFFSPLQVFLNKNILQYKVLNFTVSGYQDKRMLATPECVGLTYCLRHQNINVYVSNLEEYFLYEFEV
ncbi:uncharacterized protein LOC142333111 isoform X2 [Lycorma delicatula]|uniref:uncharacterized protein LOC142333111 isoform X2 n=1 Tax=Lycorma delicatula TaxID=130591 RepID=UPI003F5146BE